jgi:hypothetical protein
MVAAIAIGCGGPNGGGGGQVCSGSSGPSICIDKSSFAAGEPITVRFAGGPGLPKDWIAVYPGSCCSSTCPVGSTLWEYCATDTHTATTDGVTSGMVLIDASANSNNWPLAPGSWDLLYLSNDAYAPMARLSFQIEGSGGGATGSCGNSSSSSSSSGGCTSDSQCSSDCSNDCYQCLSGSCTCGSEDAYGVCTF